jgi:hypothetical protein
VQSAYLLPLPALPGPFLVTTPCLGHATGLVYTRALMFPSMHSSFPQQCKCFSASFIWVCHLVFPSLIIERIIARKTGSTAAFNAFSGVGTICLGVSYVLPVGISLWQGRREIATARYYWGTFGAIANVVAIAWVAFFIVLFCMPAALPVHTDTMSTLHRHFYSRRM